MYFFRHKLFFVFFLIDFIRNYYEVTLADIITETGVGVIFGAAAIIPGVIFFIFSDKFAEFISRSIARTEKRISKTSFPWGRMLYQMCEMQLPGCTLPISGETFFVDGSIWNAGNTGLSGQRDRILLRTWNDHLYQLFFPGIKVFMRRKSQPASSSVICRKNFRFYFCERLT